MQGQGFFSRCSSRRCAEPLLRALSLAGARLSAWAALPSELIVWRTILFRRSEVLRSVYHRSKNQILLSLSGGHSKMNS